MQKLILPIGVLWTLRGSLKSLGFIKRPYGLLRGRTTSVDPKQTLRLTLGLLKTTVLLKGPSWSFHVSLAECRPAGHRDIPSRWSARNIVFQHAMQALLCAPAIWPNVQSVGPNVLIWLYYGL